LRWTTEYRLHCDGPHCHLAVGPAPDQDACVRLAHEECWVAADGKIYCPTCATLGLLRIPFSTVRSLAEKDVAFQLLLGIAKLGPPELPAIDRETPVPSHHLPSSSKCEHCGRGRVGWGCRQCKLRLCWSHHSCPVCDKERTR
jgi:hypothetical protein